MLQFLTKSRQSTMTRRLTTPTQGLITGRFPIAGNVQEIRVLANSGTGNAVFQVRINGADVFDEPDQPELATGEEFVTADGLDIDVELGETFALDFVSADGSGIYDNPTLVIVMEDGETAVGGPPVECIAVAASDQSTAITTGAAKVTFRMPYDFDLQEVRASAKTAPTGAAIVIDVNEAGASVLSTKISIDASEKTSTTAATPAVIDDPALADDAEITIDFDQVGSTVAGAGVVVYLIGQRVV